MSNRRIQNYKKRALDLAKLARSKSLFLFGPRQTGKSTLIYNELPDALTYNLLDSDIFLTLSRRPGQLREEIHDLDRIVVIDEIQKLPQLLDEVHLLMETRGIRFLLTGSSARKLRRGGVNLLGGRARSYTLHPFIYSELSDFNLRRALDIGLVPSIYLSESPVEDLKSYTGDYLTQEIAAEGLTRNIPAFSRFLEVAALCNGQLINYSQIANDAQVAKSTVQEYFQILKDTLIANELGAWKQTVKRKPIVTSKFYFFDVGVARYLQHRRGLKSRSPEFGEAFECYIYHELRSYIDYQTSDGTLHFWRSKSGFEVDFVLNNKVAIEVKAKTPLGKRDFRGIQALQEENKLRRYVIVCMEQRPRRVDGIDILPWNMFLEQLWDGVFT